MAVQNTGYKKSVEFLRQLGLLTDQIDAYLYLLQNGPQTVLGLSRGLKTGRTKLYPLLDALAERQLVDIHERHYGTSYKARTDIEHLVIEHESTAQQLRTNLPAALNSMLELCKDSPTTSKVIKYQGIDGLKQMRWNTAKAKDQLVIMKHGQSDKLLGRHFISKMTVQYKSKNATLTEIKNDTNFEIYIYDNVVAIIDFASDDIRGEEIHSQLLASQQRARYLLQT